MDAQGDSAAKVSRSRALVLRETKMMAAVQVRSIEFRPFVERAVANLIDNTPDKRGEIYARARGVVKRRLQLLRLPAPIAEFERLALDLTIRKIERRWRAREGAKRAVPQKRPEPPPLRNAATHAFTLFAEALKAFGTFLRLVLIVVLGH